MAGGAGAYRSFKVWRVPDLRSHSQQAKNVYTRLDIQVVFLLFLGRGLVLGSVVQFKFNAILRPLLLSFVLLGIFGCTTYNNRLEPLALVPFPAPKDVPEYKIKPGDTLDVKFFYSPDLNETVTVRPDGRISLQLIDDVLVSGFSATAVDQILTRRYGQKLPDTPDISVIVRSFSDQRIYIAGEVRTPGEFELKNKMSLFHAITAAGGFTDDANRGSVLIIRQQGRGDPVAYVASLSDSDLPQVAQNGVYAPLMPRDIVYVPKSGIAKVNLFMDQFVHETLLFNGFSAGFTGVYELNNKDEAGTVN